jgi:hypothetical protein
VIRAEFIFVYGVALSIYVLSIPRTGLLTYAG